MITMEQIGTADISQKTEISEEVFYYYLEVLPPVFMQKKFTFTDGLTVRALFGFAEGYEPITVYWQEGDKYFCRRSTLMNRWC